MNRKPALIFCFLFALGALAFTLPAVLAQTAAPTVYVKAGHLFDATSDNLRDNMVLVVRYLTILLPIFVTGAFISGMIDARVRLKKLVTPILYSKIVAGGIFFISSLAAAYLAFVLKEFHHTLFFVMDGLFILAFVCSVVVGKLGTLLICTKVQG